MILNMVFGKAEVAVDTHIFRVANRTGLAPGKTPRAVEDQLVATTPKEYMKDAHHWLLLHGRYVCVARVPACPKCIIADLCEYRDKTPTKKLEKSDAPVVRRVGPRPPDTKAIKRTGGTISGPSRAPAAGDRTTVTSKRTAGDRTIGARKRRPRAAG